MSLINAMYDEFENNRIENVELKQIVIDLNKRISELETTNKILEDINQKNQPL